MTEKEQAREYALVAARAMDEKKATDIVIQDVSELLNITDFFVICTAANARRVDSVTEYVEELLTKECDIKPISIEGLEQGDWVLMDYGPIVVHVFMPATRDFYRLEQLWDTAPTIDVALAGIEDPVYGERIAKLLGRNSQGAQEATTEE